MSVIVICAAIVATLAVATGVAAFVVRRRDLDRDQAASATRAEAVAQLRIPEPRDRRGTASAAWTEPRHKRS